MLKKIPKEIWLAAGALVVLVFLMANPSLPIAIEREAAKYAPLIEDLERQQAETGRYPETFEPREGGSSLGLKFLGSEYVVADDGAWYGLRFTYEGSLNTTTALYLSFREEWDTSPQPPDREAIALMYQGHLEESKQGTGPVERR